jgi:hypothetical protein
MLEGMTPPQRYRPNRVDAILAQLDAKDQEILLKALNDRAWSAAALAKALTERGLTISDTVIQRYRHSNDLAR